MSLVAKVALAFAFIVAPGGSWGCAAARKSAAQDPMRCEQDPSCSKGRTTYVDCSRQCADNPDCTDRCREMQIDRVGAP